MCGRELGAALGLALRAALGDELGSSLGAFSPSTVGDRRGSWNAAGMLLGSRWASLTEHTGKQVSDWAALGDWLGAALGEACRSRTGRCSGRHWGRRARASQN
jgi:hypothetical protein